MERAVSIQRDKKTGHYILHPLGTFRGYGGYVGINPYRELPPNSVPELIGQSTMELLELSGPTGFHIKDINAYREQTDGEDTSRIRDKYISGVNSTAAMARRFHNAEVSREARHRSWLVVKFKYDSTRKSFVPDESKRVNVSEGASSLGQILVHFLQ
jgi:hypothetical protein